jgi:hypothetical protein
MAQGKRDNEAVFNGIVAEIEDCVANKNLTELEVYGLAQTLLKNRCCLCGCKRNLKPVFDGQVCNGCLKEIRKGGL